MDGGGLQMQMICFLSLYGVLCFCIITAAHKGAGESTWQVNQSWNDTK